MIARPLLRSDSAQQLHPGILILQPPTPSPPNARKACESLQKPTLGSPISHVICSLLWGLTHRHPVSLQEPAPWGSFPLPQLQKAPAATVKTQGSVVYRKQSHFSLKAKGYNPYTTPIPQNLPLHPSISTLSSTSSNPGVPKQRQVLRRLTQNHVK